MEQPASLEPPPLVILCTPRSFSTVVCAMLGRHPQLYAFPELNLFLADELGDLLDFDDTQSLPPGYTSGLLRALAELHFGAQTPENFGRARAWLEARRDWPTRRVFDFLLGLVRPRVGIDKSPRTALSRQSLRRARAFHPSARFLHLTRHPAPALRSMLETGRALVTGPQETRTAANFFAHLWCFAQQSVLDFTASLPPGRWMRVRGEDLLSRPDGHLQAVAAWLGVRIDGEAVAAMRHPEHWPYAIPAPVAGDGDAKFFEDPRLRPPSGWPPPPFPPEWGLEPALAENLRKLAAGVGYE